MADMTLPSRHLPFAGRAVVDVKHALDPAVVVGDVDVHEHPGRMPAVRDDLPQHVTIGGLEGPGA